MTLYFLDCGMGCWGKLGGIWPWDLANVLEQDDKIGAFVPLSFPGGVVHLTWSYLGGGGGDNQCHKDGVYCLVLELPVFQPWC